MSTGIIMRFDTDRGFGFIRPDEGGKDLFMHVSELRGLTAHDIDQGVTRVSYREEASDKGPKAVHVVVTDAGDTERYDPAEAYREPAPATVAGWKNLWDRWAKKAFEDFVQEARANGWVQD